MKLVSTMLLAAGLMIFACPAQAQYHPDPVDLNIPNIEQGTNNWCWAAVIAQILDRYSYGDTPSQCEVVNISNTEDGNGSINCCTNSSDPVCDRTSKSGGIELNFFLRRYSVPHEIIEIPKTPEKVYEYLKDGKCLLVEILRPEGNGVGHLFLVTGIYWEGDEAILRINNPAVPGRGIASFDKTYGGWRVVIAIG